MSKHLTSEEMDALLAGRHEVNGHRDECGVCSEEVDDLRRLLSGVRQSATIAAEKHRSLALRGAHSSLQPVKRMSLRDWALPIAAVLIVAVTAPVEMQIHKRHEAALEKERVHAAALLAHRQQQQQMADEALLGNVQNDLSISVPRPLQPLTVATTSTTDGNGQP